MDCGVFKVTSKTFEHKEMDTSTLTWNDLATQLNIARSTDMIETQTQVIAAIIALGNAIDGPAAIQTLKHLLTETRRPNTLLWLRPITQTWIMYALYKLGQNLSEYAAEAPNVDIEYIPLLTKLDTWQTMCDFFNQTAAARGITVSDPTTLKAYLTRCSGKTRQTMMILLDITLSNYTQPDKVVRTIHRRLLLRFDRVDLGVMLGRMTVQIPTVPYDEFIIQLPRPTLNRIADELDLAVSAQWSAAEVARRILVCLHLDKAREARLAKPSTEERDACANDPIRLALQKRITKDKQRALDTTNELQREFQTQLDQQKAATEQANERARSLQAQLAQQQADIDRANMTAADRQREQQTAAEQLRALQARLKEQQAEMEHRAAQIEALQQAAATAQATYNQAINAKDVALAAEMAHRQDQIDVGTSKVQDLHDQCRAQVVALTADIAKCKVNVDAQTQQIQAIKEAAKESEQQHQMALAAGDQARAAALKEHQLALEQMVAAMAEADKKCTTENNSLKAQIEELNRAHQTALAQGDHAQAARIAQQQQAIEQLERDMRTADEKYRAADEQCRGEKATLLQKLIDLDKARVTALAQGDHAQAARIAQQQQAIEQLERDMRAADEKYRAEKTALQQKISDLERDRATALANGDQTAIAKIDAALAKNKELEAQIQVLNDTIETLKRDHAAAIARGQTDKATTVQIQLDNLTRKEKLVAELMDRVHKCDTTIEELQDKNTRAKGEGNLKLIAESEDTKARLIIVQQALDEQVKKALQESIVTESLRARIAELERELAANSQAQATAVANRDPVASAHHAKERTSLKDEHAELTTQLASYKAQVTNLTATVDKLRAANSTCTDKLAAAEQSIAQLKQVRDTHPDNANLTETLERATAQLKVCHERAAYLDSQVVQSQTAGEILKAERDVLDKHITSLTEQVTTLVQQPKIILQEEMNRSTEWMTTSGMTYGYARERSVTAGVEWGDKQMEVYQRTYGGQFPINLQTLSLPQLTQIDQLLHLEREVFPTSHSHLQRIHSLAPTTTVIGAIQPIQQAVAATAQRLRIPASGFHMAPGPQSLIQPQALAQPFYTRDELMDLRNDDLRELGSSQFGLRFLSKARKFEMVDSILAAQGAVPAASMIAAPMVAAVAAPAIYTRRELMSYLNDELRDIGSSQFGLRFLSKARKAEMVDDILDAQDAGAYGAPVAYSTPVIPIYSRRELMGFLNDDLRDIGSAQFGLRFRSGARKAEMVDEILDAQDTIPVIPEIEEIGNLYLGGSMAPLYTQTDLTQMTRTDIRAHAARNFNVQLPLGRKSNMIAEYLRIAASQPSTQPSLVQPIQPMQPMQPMQPVATPPAVAPTSPQLSFRAPQPAPLLPAVLPATKPATLPAVRAITQSSAKVQPSLLDAVTTELANLGGRYNPQPSVDRARADFRRDFLGPNPM